MVVGFLGTNTIAAMLCDMVKPGADPALCAPVLDETGGTPDNAALIDADKSSDTPQAEK